MWNLPPPPGFQGLRDDLPLARYSRNLPHWRQAGATYFVTFRLADSLPESRLHELAGLRREWERLHPPPHTDADRDELARLEWEQTERWLDAGHGECVLRHSQPARIVAASLHHFDSPSTDPFRSDDSPNPQMTAPSTVIGHENSRCELGAYVVMPNHVHAIVRPTHPGRWQLEDIVGSWKRHSANSIQRLLNRSGTLWQEETFDRIIRDEEHLWRSLQYIGRNPKNAGLAKDSCIRWVRPEWEGWGWTFDDRRPIA